MRLQSSRLDDRYELRRLLGTGPVGQVWESYDHQLGRDVAVKVFHAHLAADEAFRARVRLAARHASTVRHPNAVAVQDVGGDGRFVVMDRVDGWSLRRLLDSRGPLPIHQAVTLAIGACSALAAAHAAGVLHGGLKPENLFLTADGQVSVSDFAIASAALVIGLPEAAPYRSPELAQAGRADDRSDLYALGCCLYEATTGRAPRSSMNPANIPTDLRAVVTKALAEHPNDRYQTPMEFRRALQRVLPQGPDGPVRTALEPRTRSRRPRRPRPLAAVLAVGLACAVAVTMLAILRPGARSTPSAAPGTTRQVREFVRQAPSVVGATELLAMRELRQAGVSVKVRRVRHQQVARGRVVSTSPPAGTPLRADQTVELTISNGSGPVTVADLIALIDADPAAAGRRAPRFRGRLVRLDTLPAPRRQLERAELLAIARAGATNGDFTPSFSAAAVEVLGRR
jgi:hypothetical protein